MIYKEVDSGFIVGFKVGREYREVLEISHLLFAENTMFVMPPKRNLVIFGLFFVLRQCQV